MSASSSAASSPPSSPAPSGPGGPSAANDAPKRCTIKINPKAALAATLWKCGDLTCKNTDMTNQPRERTGRKFISDFFGRNKSETSAIPDDVWAWVCRKDYQRSKYASDKSPDAYSSFWLSAVMTQLIRLQIWRPEAIFEVKLLNRAEERLNTYNSALVQNGNDTAAAKRLVFVGPASGKKGPIPASNADSIDPIQAQHIKDTFSGFRTIDYIINFIYPWIDQSLQSGALTRMPPIEFLVQEPGEDETVNDPSENFQMWRDFLEPRWTEQDQQAAIALMALSKQELRPMNLTWEAHHAAVAEDAAKRAAALAATTTPPPHTAESEGQSSKSKDKPRMTDEEKMAAALAATTPPPSSPTTTTQSHSPSSKSKGKRRMVDEDEQATVPELVYNGRNVASKKRKIAPAAPLIEKRRTRSSVN